MVALDTSVEGVAAIRSFGEEWLVAFAEYAVQPEEILDLGNGVVFAVTRQNVRPAGSTSGALLQEVWVYAFVWVDGSSCGAPPTATPTTGRLFDQRVDNDLGVAARHGRRAND